MIECGENIRSDFPGLSTKVDGEPIIYLDNAATTLKPSAMVEALSDYYLGISTNIHRGKNYAIESVSNQFEQVRYKIAHFLGCKGNEISFHNNTTDALNQVAGGLNLTESDTVVCFIESHHSNILPWKSRAKVEFVAVNELGGFDMESYVSLLSKQPKVVAITHCSNASGVYVDIEKLCKMAKEVGAIVVVDGAQSIPHRRVNLNTLDIDFLAFSAHKMLGPTGLGILFGREDILNSLVPLKYGGGMVDWVDTNSFRNRKIPHRLEAGTPHIAGVLAFGAALDYLERVGYDNIQEHDSKLARLMYAEAKKRDYMLPLNREEGVDRGAILSVFIPRFAELDDIARYLSDSFGVMCRNGHLCTQPYINAMGDGQVIRASAYIYNTEKEIICFFESLDKIINTL
jgi:Selenocysteine lyase